MERHNSALGFLFFDLPDIISINDINVNYGKPFNLISIFCVALQKSVDDSVLMDLDSTLEEIAVETEDEERIEYINLDEIDGSDSEEPSRISEAVASMGKLLLCFFSCGMNITGKLLLLGMLQYF